MMSDRTYLTASQRLIAATMVFEAKRKEFDAYCWIDDGLSLELARAAAHQAFDTMLDAQQVQIEVLKRQQEGGALVAQQ